MQKGLFYFLLAIVLLYPSYSLANGGDQRVVDGKYLINLSRSPFTPSVGAETSFLVSFVDIAKDKLIAEDLIVDIRIAKLGSIGGKREFIFEKDNVRVEGGVTDFTYAFLEPGLHEIFFDFAFLHPPVGGQQKIYKAPDFLLDIQESKVRKLNLLSTLLAIAGIIAGFIIGYVARSKLLTKL